MDVKQSLASLLNERLADLGVAIESSDACSIYNEYDFNIFDADNRLMALLTLRHQDKLRIEYVGLGTAYIDFHKGIGTRIVGCVEDLARQMGHDEVRINCSLSDGFWRKRGYAPVRDAEYSEEWGKRIR